MDKSSLHKEHLKDYLNKHKYGQGTKSGLTGSVSSASTTDKRHNPGQAGASSSKQNLSTQQKSSKHLSSQIQKATDKRKFISRRIPPAIKGKASIHYLPPELLLDVFSFLPAADLLKAACVCKQWNQLANDNFLWERIFRTQARIARETTAAKHPDKPHLSYWKSLCIKRCTEKRNKKSLKLLKKIHPYTGLPSFTEKALKSAGVSFQLCLIDGDGREYQSSKCDLFYHNMSAAVRWFDLTTLPMARVKKLKVYSCNPLFVDDKGQPVKNGPYQRSLMTSVDLKWSRFVKESPPVAQDETVLLYKVPDSDIVVATWKADGELAFVATGYHHQHLLQRCLLGDTSSLYTLPEHTPIPDDIDPSYGLHHYQCTLNMRNIRQSLWTQQFINLHCKKEDIKDGFVCFQLIRKDHTTDHVVMHKQFNLPWKTELFKGKIKNVAWLDLTLLDERGTVFWTISSPVTAKEKEKAKNEDFDYNGEHHLTATLTGEKGQVLIELSQMDDDRTFVSNIEVQILTSTINEWFETSY